MKVTNMLTKYNYDIRDAKIKYIVIHWVGAASSAVNNAKYFQGGNRNASAHYFVDDYGIVKSVRERYAAWAVGSNGYLDQGSPFAEFGHKYYGKCNNHNSVSIEMCCVKQNSRLCITDKTIRNTAELVQAIQKRLGIDDEHVIRHFDVSGKLCPMPYIDATKWRKVHAILTGNYFRVKTKGDLITRTTYSLMSKKVRKIKKDKIYGIVRVHKNRGQLTNGDWITITDKYVEKL